MSIVTRTIPAGGGARRVMAAAQTARDLEAGRIVLLCHPDGTAAYVAHPGYSPILQGAGGTRCPIEATPAQLFGLPAWTDHIVTLIARAIRPTSQEH